MIRSYPGLRELFGLAKAGKYFHFVRPQFRKEMQTYGATIWPYDNGPLQDPKTHLGVLGLTSSWEDRHGLSAWKE